MSDNAVKACELSVPVPAQDEYAQTESFRTPRASRKVWKTVLRLVITASVLFLLFRQVHWSQILKTVSTIDRGVFWLVAVLWIPTQWFQFKRWDLLARSASTEIRRVDIHKGYWVGFTLGLVTPGRIGEYGRALALHKCSLARAVGVSILERTYSAIVTNGTGLIALALIPGIAGMTETWLNTNWIRVLLIVIGLLILAFGIRPAIAYRPLSAMAARLPGKQVLLRVLEVLREVSTARSTLLLILALAALFSSLLQYAILLQALGAQISFEAAMPAALLTFFIKGALPLTIGSLGVAEWAAVVIFSYFGVEPEIAVAASLLLFSVNVLIPGLIGSPYISGLRVPTLNKTVVKPVL